MTPQELQRETFTALRAVVSRLISVGPTVLALEDLHWADPTSLRLTEDLATLAGGGPLLVLYTRPDPRAELAGFELGASTRARSSRHRVELAPLDKDSERDLARVLVGEDAGQDVLDNVLRGVEGNPLVLEERYFSMVETGAWCATSRLAPGPPSAAPQPSPTCWSASCVPGQTCSPRPRKKFSVPPPCSDRSWAFPFVRLVPGRRSAAGTVLEELSGAGLLQEVPNTPEPTYRFRHALIQEATYGGRCARSDASSTAERPGPEGLSPGRLEDVAPALGGHYAAAGEPERALHYFELAGDHAVEAFANDEAESSFRAGLAIIGEGRPEPVGTFRESPDVTIAPAGANAAPTRPAGTPRRPWVEHCNRS